MLLSLSHNYSSFMKGKRKKIRSMGEKGKLNAEKEIRRERDVSVILLKTWYI